MRLSHIRRRPYLDIRQGNLRADSVADMDLQISHAGRNSARYTLLGRRIVS